MAGKIMKLLMTQERKDTNNLQEHPLLPKLGTLDEGVSYLERGRNVISVFFTYLICLQAPY
jgi:hypothetical protein